MYCISSQLSSLCRQIRIINNSRWTGQSPMPDIEANLNLQWGFAAVEVCSHNIFLRSSVYRYPKVKKFCLIVYPSPPLYGQNPPLSDDVILKPIIDTDCTVCNTHPEIMAKNYGYKVLSGLSWAELATDSNRSSSSVLQADLIYLKVKRGSRKNIIICKLICPLSYTKYCISIVMGFFILFSPTFCCQEADEPPARSWAQE